MQVQLDGGIYYPVEVLYGYTPITDRGIRFVESTNGEWGNIDRHIDSYSTTCVIRGDEESIFRVDKYLRNSTGLGIKLENNEKIFGAEFSGRIGGTEDGTLIAISTSIITKSEMKRDNLVQFSISLSLALNTVLPLDARVSHAIRPRWETDMRYNPGYSAGPSSNIKFKWMNDGGNAVSGNATSDYITRFSTQLTIEEAARWRYSLIQGANRLDNTMGTVGVDPDVFMELFGVNDFTEYAFWVRSWSESCLSFNIWTFNFELILRPKAST